ncbi:MAG: PAS domain S-box protein [Methanomicrobiaceae archaeon]|nr:PAS domain S-box protein [Methanomicrobiaceae archaeon]
MIEEHKKILEILKDNPRGMSVTQIADAIRMNRISVARYLDTLLTSGQVDMVRHGQAKLYYLSHRVPVSSLLEFSSDYVVVLDQKQKIVQANSNFLNLFGKERDEVMGSYLFDILYPLDQLREVEKKINKAFDGTEVTEEICIIRDDEELFFEMKIIPTAFADGSPGITLILEDITQQRRAQEALAQNEQRLRLLVERISKLLASVDEYGTRRNKIRDPLQVIVGIADMEGGKASERIVEQAKEIDTLIQEIDMGGLEAQNLREFLRKYYGSAKSGEGKKRTAESEST